MATRAQARVTFSAAGSPAGTFLDGFSAPVDTAVGIVSLTLTYPTDRADSCIYCSLVASATGTASTPVARVAAEIGTDTAADTVVRVRTYDSSGVARDPAVGTGFCVMVTDRRK